MKETDPAFNYLSMSFRVPRLRRKPKFTMAASNPTASRPSVQSNLTDRISGPDEDPTDETMTIPAVPSIYTTLPILKDDLETETSRIQDQTVDDILPFMSLQNVEDPEDLNSFGVPKLQKAKHIRFLKKIETDYPPLFVAADATRPWMVYWSMAG